MEIYGECDICGKWNDLIVWRNIASVCLDCANKLDKRAPYVNGRYKVDNQKAFEIIREDVRSGKK